MRTVDPLLITLLLVLVLVQRKYEAYFCRPDEQKEVFFKFQWTQILVYIFMSFVFTA